MLSDILQETMHLPWPAQVHKLVTEKLIMDVDYHIFGPLKESLKGQRFHSDEDVKAVVLNWFHEQPTSFFADRICNLSKK